MIPDSTASIYQPQSVEDVKGFPFLIFGFLQEFRLLNLLHRHYYSNLLFSPSKNHSYQCLCLYCGHSLFPTYMYSLLLTDSCNGDRPCFYRHYYSKVPATSHLTLHKPFLLMSLVPLITNIFCQFRSHKFEGETGFVNANK